MVFHYKKSPLTICEHFPHSLTKEASIWLVLVFSSHLFLALITPSHTALWVLVVMYYCVVAFTVNKTPCEGKTGKYHINVTELYLLVFVWLFFFYLGFSSPVNHKQSCTIFFVSVLLLLHPQREGSAPQREQGKVWNMQRPVALTLYF